MRKINYRLFVSDFDGTLVKNDGTIDEDTKKIISEYRKNGGSFAISTGRLPEGILERAKELGLKGAVACGQGSVIVDIESKEVLLQGTIPNKTAVEICKKLEEMDLHIHIYDLWDFYCNKDDEGLKLYENLVRTKAKLVTDRPISEFLQEKGFGVCKILVMVNPKENAALCEKLEKIGFEGCCITKSGEFLVEIISSSYSKGTAVEFLAKHYGVPLEKVVCVGDQHNDIPMIQKAGLGVAVKNAAESLKSEAAYVCEYTNEEGAVGKLIEKFGYAEE